MKVIKKIEPKVKVKGKGMNGKIVVHAKRIYKEIPVVLFSSEEANTLLEIVDRVEDDRRTCLRKKRSFKSL